MLRVTNECYAHVEIGVLHDRVDERVIATLEWKLGPKRRGTDRARHPLRGTTMKKLDKNKLKLRTETVRLLDKTDLGAVVGGMYSLRCEPGVNTRTCSLDAGCG